MSNEYFQELGGVYSLLPDYREAYIRLGRLYLRLLDEYTSPSGIHLVGAFAKTDYLLKEKSASADLKHKVNGMRLRLTTRTETQSPENFIIDFQVLCFFISLLYGEDIPASLSQNFVKIPPSYKSSTSLQVEYLRVLVNSWDEEYIHCTLELTGEDVSVRYSGMNQLYGYDNSYLAEILYKGVMLNIISPRLDESGAILPEFVILDPDYLVDVSTVATCFESFATSPLLAVLRRLEPTNFTEPALLGNFAGKLLDEVLHMDDTNAMSDQTLLEHYYVTAKSFLQDNPVGILCVQPDRQFHSQAWQQMHNIYEALVNILPTELNKYKRSKVVVEPTFFSEMLGLQGRMDMLQLDMRVLVEQKSGNGSFVPGANEYDLPKYREQHYIQMLLYMAIIRYNYRKAYDENNHELHAFLLYSKYTHPLVGLGFAPELLFKALKMRNLYVAQENDFCKGGISRLMLLKADDLNEKGLINKLWTQYQRPRIQAILNTIQDCPHLENTYFQRFYQFIALEHKLAKVGNQTKEASGFASAWVSSLDEKMQCGNILLNLEISSTANTYGELIDSIYFRTNGEFGNFRQGDIVVAYPYVLGQVPDLRRAIVYRGTISKISNQDLILRLRTAQRNADVFEKCDDVAWCIEHDFIESSFNSLYKGLYSFLLAPKDRRDLILVRRPPYVVTDRVLKGDYGQFNELQSRIKNSLELFLVIGPPGTGKTSFGMLNTLQEELLESGSRVLIVSYTNRSVDEICSKLYPTIDFIRIGGTAQSSDLYADRLFDNIVSQYSSSSGLRKRFLDTRVIVGTTSSISSFLPLLSMNHFSLCIVDEASQVLEPHLLPLLSLCCSDGLPCISKFVMIGDHKQLPAVVQQRTAESRVEDPLLLDIGLTDCRNSLFERLLTTYRNNPDVCYMLRYQGRMHRDIAQFPNIAFYGKMLTEVPLEHQLIPSSCPRLRFIDVHVTSDAHSDKVNNEEAEAIAEELIKIWEQNKATFTPHETVGVIVPYRNQISAIRTVISNKIQNPEHPLTQITIDTVERYQGSQRRYILYGFTVRNPYQLHFLTETTFIEDGMLIDRKLNVVMTRAKEYLLMVGNAPLLRTVPLYSRLLDFIEGVGD